MLRKIVPRIVLLAIVCLAILVVWSSSSFHDCVERQQAAYSQETKEKVPPLLLARGSQAAICIRCAGHVIYEYRDAATAVATILIAIFTFTLWRSTDKLWEAGTEQFNLARDEFNSVHRPKIRLKHLWLAKDIWEGEQIKATADFVNSGTGTAFVREIGIATHIVKNGRTLPPNPAFAEVGKFPLNRYELRSGITLSVGELNDWKVLTAAQSVEIFEEKARFFFVGYIEYEDSRGAVRKTAFCRVLRFPNKTHSPSGGRFVKEDDPDYEYED
jgi:hypothetical protein